YALALGYGVSALGIPLPDILIKPLEALGSIMTPLALILLGVFISHLHFRRLPLRDLSIPVAAKLILMPALAGAVASVLGMHDSLLRNVLIVESAMPSAVSSIIYADLFKESAEFASLIVLFTVLLSSLAIPLVIMALF
ncbi:hypothetical protein COY95_02160, partial [Candidatus Woesearchaeota archaeon CG_4_10_14_0_8_um_filter_47_5]